MSDQPAGAPSVRLLPVDSVEITVVMDLFLDILMAGQQDVRRFPLEYDWSDRDNLVAEHGFSVLITVERNGKRDSILYDAGLSADALTRNIDVLQVKTGDLRAIAISHGHVDHHGGLAGLFARHSRMAMPFVIHPDAWKERKIAFPTGSEIRMPPPSLNDIEREGLTVVEDRGPTLLIDDVVLVSGQVERTTEFENGLPPHLARTGDGSWVPDPMIWDDQNIVVHVRGRGLVVVSACSHAGAVNVLRNARRLTGENRIAAFLGGFHLTGGIFEPIIPITVREIAAMDVGMLIPCHCTGWRAVHELARSLPDAFVQPSVGTTFSFRAAE